MTCRKCEGIATVHIKKEFWYCENCFLINTNHKFRSCLGKSKVLSPNEKVLVCLSGGASSTVLMHLVFSGINSNGTKTLRIEPYFLHVIETTTDKDIKNSFAISEQCKKYNFHLHVINMHEHYSKLNMLPNELNTTQKVDSETGNKIKSSSSPTINHDVAIKMKRNIFIHVANELHCKIIFTAETTTLLAMRLLSNLAIGRGTQVENDIGFADRRDENIKILRPMRDITNEEIEYYVRIKQLKPINDNLIKENSLQSVIQRFVLDLQENSPSTISAVCKTADKIGSLENITNGKKCTLCQSNIDFKNPKLTAVEATIFSRQISSYRHADKKDKHDELLQINVNEDPIFPSLYETLCYSCSRNFSNLSR